MGISRSGGCPLSVRGLGQRLATAWNRAAPPRQATAVRNCCGRSVLLCAADLRPCVIHRCQHPADTSSLPPAPRQHAPSQIPALDCVTSFSADARGERCPARPAGVTRPPQDRWMTAGGCSTQWSTPRQCVGRGVPDQTLISVAGFVTSILRDLAFSATGMRRVSTPAS